jgi:hypothetical protein
MVFESFGRTSFGLKAQTSMTAPTVASEVIVRVIDGPMDIDQEISK